jgi:acyl-CoA reductase-like NAD-dependent aldehyde dehydrogenase
MLVTALAAPAALAGNIAGIWKHSEEAGWIEIRVVDGVASAKVGFMSRTVSWVRVDEVPGE